MNHSIEEIEKELRQIVSNDKRNWIRIYELMTEVDSSELWQGAYHSFTQWVRDFAKKAKVHESLLWNRKKAGSVYADYAKRAEQKGQTVKPMNELNISPDSLVFAQQIAKGNKDVEDSLIKQAISGEKSRKAMSDAWHKVKAAKGSKEAQKSEEIRIETGTAVKEKITAKFILECLSHDGWIISGDVGLPIVPSRRGREWSYRSIPEFSVRTGTTHHARRIDTLVIENIACEESHDFNFHGMEIKISKSDLINDHKIGEYEDFVDYLWFVVPKELADEAVKVSLSEWGILSVESTGKIKMVQRATKMKPMRRNDTMIEVIKKLL